MTWSDYWKEVYQLIQEDDSNNYFFQDPESIERIKPLFKKKWKKGIDVNSAYYDIIGLT